jgi:predicted nucleotidyltransferase
VKVFFPPYSRAELIDLLKERVEHLAASLPLIRAVLFGSWAKGRATAFSDIDLLVVHAGPRRADAYDIVQQAIDLRGLEPHIYSEDEAAQMASILGRWIAEGVELFPEPEMSS